MKKFKKNQLISQKGGGERKKRIEENFGKNEWVKTFYAEHTFEVDLIKEGNSKFFIEIAKLYYSEKFNDIKEELESDALDVYGRRVLRMSKKIGKGWFATELAEKIKIDFEIPDYIINAIVFSGQNTINENVLSKMLRYQCESIGNNGEVKNILKNFNSKSLEEKVEAYKEEYPNDNYSRFYDSWKEIETLKLFEL